MCDFFLDDFTILLCPGIASNSECLYVKTCVHHAQANGFRVAVLNHLGALPDVPLTAPRIFSYGQLSTITYTMQIILHAFWLWAHFLGFSILLLVYRVFT